MSSTRSDALNPCAARTPSTRVARVRPTLEKLAFRGNRSPLTKSRLPPQAPSVESKGPIFDGTPKPLQNRRLTRRVFVQLPGPFSEPDPQFRDRLLDSEPLVSGGAWQAPGARGCGWSPPRWASRRSDRAAARRHLCQPPERQGNDRGLRLRGGHRRRARRGSGVRGVT
jgi:hypothetical protein